MSVKIITDSKCLNDSTHIYEICVKQFRIGQPDDAIDTPAGNDVILYSCEVKNVR